MIKGDKRFWLPYLQIFLVLAVAHLQPNYANKCLGWHLNQLTTEAQEDLVSHDVNQIQQPLLSRICKQELLVPMERDVFCLEYPRLNKKHLVIQLKDSTEN